MKSRNPFGELRAIERRVGPRFDPEQCGHCPCCALGPTVVLPVSTVTWAACDSCGFRWPIGENAFTGDAGREQPAEELAFVIALLAQYDGVDSVAPAFNRGHTMTATTNQTTSAALPALPYDLRSLQRPGETPLLYGMVNIERRRTIYAAVAQYLREHPARDSAGRRRAGMALWEAVRYRPCDGRGTTIETALREADDRGGLAGQGLEGIFNLLHDALDRRDELRHQLQLLDDLAAALTADAPAGAAR